MIILQILLSLTSIGFFLAPEFVDNKAAIKLFDLPRECLENIRLFNETCLCGPCCGSCFIMFHAAYEIEKSIQIDKMIKKCRLDESEDRYNYFSLLDAEEKDELCADLEDWKELLKKVGVIYYKYRKIDPLEGSEDLKKLKRIEYYEKMYKRMLSKQKNFREKQVALLKLYRVYLGPSDSDSNSTSSGMSTIPEGSEYDSDSDSD